MAEVGGKRVGRELLQGLALVAFVWVCVGAQPLPQDEILALLDIQRVLEYPSAIASWDYTTDFCSLPPNEALTLVVACDGGSLTQLQIVGDKVTDAGPLEKAAQKLRSDEVLSSSFSMVELADALTRLERLRVVSVSSAGLWGALTDLGVLYRLQDLQVLNFSRNAINGSLPGQWSGMRGLQVMDLSYNALSGSFPVDYSSSPLNATLVTVSLAHNLLSGKGTEAVSGLTSLRNLCLDNNNLTGPVPVGVTGLISLEVLTLGNNSMDGPVPSLEALQGLKVLDLSGNGFGPGFPSLPGSVMTELRMGGNRFSGDLPPLDTFLKLVSLDFSFNQLTGSVPSVIFALPSLTTLLLQHNHLSGILPQDVVVSQGLEFIDISDNFFTGPLPAALEKQPLDAPSANGTDPQFGPVVDFFNNCFNSSWAVSLQQQHPQSYCDQQLETNFGTLKLSSGGSNYIALIAGVGGGGVGFLAALLVAVVVCTRRVVGDGKAFDVSSVDTGPVSQRNPNTTITSNGVPSELLSKARFLSQSTKLGVLSFSHNRVVYTLEQLERATNGFHRSHLIGVGKRGKVYKGRLEDGTQISIKSLLIEPRLDAADLKLHLSSLCKLRHQNLVSLLGYCMESEPDSHGRRRLFLVSEFIPNGTLRSHLSRGPEGEEPLTWAERLHAVVGAGRGLQYLHSGILPGSIKHHIKIHNVLLDQYLVAKVGDFGVPRPGVDSSEIDAIGLIRRSAAAAHPNLNLDHYRPQVDVYNFGLILLEIVLGRPPLIQNPTSDSPSIPELSMLLRDEQGPTVDLIDPAIVGAFVPESMATVLEIASKCLSPNSISRPSLEDTLWNLQYAAQVQDSSTIDPHDSLSADLIELRNINGPVQSNRPKAYGLAMPGTEVQRG